MSNILITKGGTIALARILLSCRPLLPEQTANKLYLWGQSQKMSAAIPYDQLLANLPRLMPGSVLLSVRQFAQESEQDITSELVFKFFGGSRHITEKVQEVNDFASDFGNMTWFAEWIVGHILLPVHLSNIVSGVSDAVYKNQDIEVRIGPIVIPCDVNVRKSIGLIHSATLISGDCDQDVIEYLLSEQAMNQAFRQFCNQCLRIDYTKFAIIGDHFAKTQERFARLTAGA